jgi:hypothetical protein
MKKLLYITHGSNDYIDDMLFLGLTELKKNYDIYFAISGCEFGFPKTIQERANNIFYAWKDDWQKTASSLKNIDDYPSVKIDICIIGQAWNQNQDRFFSLEKHFSNNTKILQVYSLDENGPQISIRTNPHHIFYTNAQVSWRSKKYLPFICPPALALKENNSKIEFFLNCQLGNTHESRPETVNKFLKAVIEINKQDESLISCWGQFNFGNAQRTPTNEYWSILEKTKCIVHERGAGTDAFRFWEAIATGNFVLCSQRNYYHINDMPIPPNVIFWDDNSNLISILESINNISYDDLLHRRAIAKDFIKLYHTPEARLLIMLSLLQT